MSNKPNYTTRLNLNEMIERRRAEASIEIEIPEGAPIVIPPPELWTQSVKDAQTKLRRGRIDREAFGRALLGDSEWERWASAVEAAVPGAIPGDVLEQVFVEVTTAKQGVAPGE